MNKPKLLNNTAQSYLLRGIPADLWAQAKHAAIDRGVSLRAIILDALRKEVSK